MKFAILRSEFNPEVTLGLRQGAVDFLKEQGLTDSDLDHFEAPGAFELPFMAQTLARTRKYNGIICLGAVIKGDTAHFEFISGAATYGIMQASLSTEVPISFGVLTTYTDAQAEVRSKIGDPGNKGREAAHAAYASAVFYLKSSADIRGNK